MKEATKKLAVIGLGFVGINLYQYLKENHKGDVFGYDIREDISPNSFDASAKADVIFLCLPTPFTKDHGFDCSAIEETVAKINDTQMPSKIFVIKSTVIPGTTDRLQKRYPQHRFLFVPEFLTEKFAKEDTCHPDSNIIGYTKESYSIARDILQILPEAPFERIIHAKEAEMVKYARNVYFINKVVFFNLLYDLCQVEKMDYENVKNCLAADRRIRRSHTDIWHQGGRGGAGTCFPKDLASFIQKVIKDKDKKTHAGKFFYLLQNINNFYIDSTKKDRGNQWLKS